MLQKSPLIFLRRVMERPRSVPTDAFFLEMGIWPIRFETEFRQLTYLKRIIDRDKNDPVFQLYQEMLKYSSENNWANNILDLRRKYNLPPSNSPGNLDPSQFFHTQRRPKPETHYPMTICLTPTDLPIPTKISLHYPRTNYQTPSAFLAINSSSLTSCLLR